MIKNYLKKLMFLFIALAFSGLTYGQYLNESFDAAWTGTPAAPTGWTATQLSGTGFIDRVTTGTNPTCTPHSGAGMARYYCYSYLAGASALLTSPVIDLTTVTPATILEFWMFRDAGYSTNFDSISFYLNTTGSINGATLLLAVNRNKTLDPIETGADGWYKYQISIPNSFNTASNYLIIKAKSAYGNNMFLDDVKIYNPVPANAVPENITFTNTTAAGTTIGWTDKSTNETSFRVYMATNVAGPYTQVGASISSLSTVKIDTAYTKVITGLSENTTYYFRISAVADLESAFLTGSNATLAGTIVGNKTIGTTGDYASLTAAFAAINTNGLAGSVNLILQSDYVSSVETFPIAPSTCATAAKTITVYPAATGLSITTATGLTLDMNGAKYVMFDGRVNAMGTTKDLTIENTFTPLANTILFRNDAVYNTIKYCKVEGRTTTSSVIFFGSTTGTLGNSNNLIENNDISADGTFTPAYLVYSAGSAGFENKNNVISNNNIFDFFIEGNSFGIYVGSNSSDWTITANSFYQTAVRSVVTTACVSYPIYIANATATSGFTVTNNYIGGSAPLCGGTPYTLIYGATAKTNKIAGITMNVGTAAVSTVTGNTITNFVLATSSGTTTGAGVLCGVNVIAGNVNVDGNNIGSGSYNTAMVCTATTTTSFLGINSASTGIVNIRNNNIGGFSVGATSTAAIGYTIAGIRTTGGTTGVNSLNITNNVIGSISNVDNMKSGLATTTGLSSVIGIQTATIGNNEIKNNTIANLTLSTTNTSSQAFGINVTGGSNVVEGNTIFALSSNSGNGSSTTASVVGISASSAIASQNINNNTIYNLNNTNATAGVGVEGIYYSGATLGANSIQRNKIYDLKTASNGLLASINGVYIGGGTCVVKNNMITLGENVTNGIEISGIRQALGVGIKFYHNSIYIGGSATAVNSNTYAFNRSQTASNCDVYNNIFVNKRTNATSTGKNYAMKINAASDYTTPYLVSDNNIFDNTVAANMFAVGSTDYDFATWKTTTVAGLFDVNSINADPLFVAPSAAIPNLHLTVGSPAESAGLLIATVTDDFDGELRTDFTPTDIGADAGIYDNITPAVSVFSPVNMATDIAVTPTIEVTFNEMVRKTDNTVLNNTNVASVISLNKVSDNSAVAFTATWDAATKKITALPSVALSGMTTYKFSLLGLEDYSNNVLSAPDTIRFTTGSSDIIAPVIDSAKVLNAAPANVVVYFSENVKATNANGVTINVDGTPATINSVSGSTTNALTFTLSAPITSHAVVTFSYVTATGNIADISDNALANVTNLAVTNNVKSAAKDILTFAILATDNVGSGLLTDINAVVGTNTITFTVYSNVDLSAIKPVITNSQYSTVVPATAVANNFNTNLTYTVTAEDATTKVYSVVINKIFTLPYADGFETGNTNQAAIANGWSQASVAGAAVWTANSTLSDYNRAPRTGSWNAYLKYSNTDWMFSPQIYMETGKTYTFSMYARQDAATGATVTVAYGANADIVSMTNIIVAETPVIAGDYQNIVGSFSPATNGIYNVGIKGAVTGVPWYLSVDDITIKESVANDASTTLAANLWSVVGSAITPTATVKNNGTANIATMNVKLDITGPSAYTYTETKVVTNLASGLTQDLTFANVTLPSVGEYIATVTTQLVGDGDITNNVLSATYSILNPATIAYGYSIYPTQAPMCFEKTNTAKLYTIADHGADLYNVYAGEMVEGVWFANDIKLNAAGTAYEDIRLITIDKTTGVKSVIASAITRSFSDMAYDYSTKTMYGISGLTATTFGLFTINLTTGVATQVGTGATGTASTLACNLSGQLYSIFADGKLYSISKVDGTSTLVGPTGVTDIKYVQSMAFDHTNADVLYWNQQGNLISGSYYTVNTATGVATKIAQTKDEAELTAIAIPYISPVTTHTVTFSVVNGNGSISASVNTVGITSGANVEEGSNVAFTAAPAANFRVKEWKLNNVVVTGNTTNSFTLNNLTANSTVTVEFEANTYAVSYSIVNGIHGILTAKVDGDLISPTATVLGGKDVVFVATPDANYRVKEWKLNAVVVTGNTTNNYTLTNLSANSTVSVEFEVIPTTNYTVTFSVVNPIGGGLTAAVGTAITSPAQVAQGSNVVFTAAPVANYEVKEWKLNGTVVAANVTNNYTLTNIAANATVSVEFKLSIGIVDATENTFSVYPVPSKDVVNVKSNVKMSRIAIVNIHGQIVAETIVDNNEAILNTSDLSNGMYQLRIETANGITMKKIQIVK